MARLLISAAHKSSGKTTVTLGLCAALKAQGLVVQPFKKGPDYIDPMWLSQASARDCLNLDPFLQTPEQIQRCFQLHSAGADISIVEGNKGLYDGLALDGSNCNAALAQLLDLPVVLVLDARGMTRGIAPLILGYQAFDKRIRIAGVILNQLGGARHESKLRAVIEHYTDVAVLGAIAHDDSLCVVERHLGLMPNHELDDAQERVLTIGARIAAQVDLPRLLQVAGSAAPFPAAVFPAPTAEPMAEAARVRIAVARDKAFGFYYPDDLLALQNAGADLVQLDTLNDAQLPPVDGLFIGGGFPEMFLPELQANATLRQDIKSKLAAGLPTYAECGGQMYLARSIRWKDAAYEMVGALNADVVMHDRPVGRGYVELQATGDAPWTAKVATDGAAPLRGHEFHYSSLENIAPDQKFAYKVLRGHGVDGRHDGLVQHQVLGSYAHLRSAAGANWAQGFVDFVRAQRDLARAECPAGALCVNGRKIATDAEGYLKNLDDWSEDFAVAQAQREQLELTEAHWQVIHFLRAYYEEHRAQAQVRAMIWHFANAWGAERGNNHHLHDLFPVGGPQKQGNRLAGLWKTKGEH